MLPRMKKVELDFYEKVVGVSSISPRCLIGALHRQQLDLLFAPPPSIKCSYHFLSVGHCLVQIKSANDTNLLVAYQH